MYYKNEKTGWRVGTSPKIRNRLPIVEPLARLNLYSVLTHDVHANILASKFTINWSGIDANILH